MRRLFSGFILILGCMKLGWSQHIQFNAIGVEDGLSQNDVSSILQDSEGFMWFGTYDGLNRFDGYEIQSFFHDNNNPQTLSGNRIRCLFEDKNKNIWIGTDGYGLNFYSLLNGKINRVETPENHNIINDIVEGTSPNEQIVATTEGLLKIKEDVGNKKGYVIEVVQSPITGFNVRSIYKLKSGNLLYATNNGVWIQKDKVFKLVDDSFNQSFNWITETKSGKIWIGSQDGLFTLDNENLLAHPSILNANILSISEGIENDLWVSTLRQGLFQLNLNNLTITKRETLTKGQPLKLSENALPILYKDKTNTLWISNKKGLLYFNLNIKGFNSLPIIKSGHIRTLFATNKSVYYGFIYDRYFKYSLENHTNKEILLPKNTNPFRVDTLSGKIHLATSKGLFVEKTPDSGIFELVDVFGDKKRSASTMFTSFSQDKFGNQYFGAFRGLLIKTKNYTDWIHNKFKNFEELRNIRVFTLLFDDQYNCLWVGTISDGIFKINIGPKGSIISVESFNEKMTGSYKIPNNSIWSFYKNKEGKFYVGTDTGLLIRKKNSFSFESIDFPDLKNKKIMGIIEDDNENLWLTNSQGLIRFDPKSGTTETFNQNNGLLTSAFTEAVSKNKKGQLFFGNISEINYLNSGTLEINPYRSEVIFTSLSINNKKIEVNEVNNGSVVLTQRLNLSDKLILNYKQNDFSIGFSSSNYSNVKVNKYRYKLLGYDEGWTIVNKTQRNARFSNIPDGNYTLLVEATNPDGKWSEAVKEIAIRVQPAPWKTWWAYLIYALLFLGLISSFIYFLINKQELRNQIALSNLKNEQEKEINEMKLTFFTDVAHEFKTPLSLVIGPLNDLIQGRISQDYKDFCYNIISRNTNRMMNLVNQLLDFRKINSGVNILKVSRNDMPAFIKEIAKAFDWQAKNANINLNIIAPESYYCHFDHDIMEKVIYNLLSNAFKYTPKNGIIEIEIKPTWRQELEYFVILIKDSGKGISNQDKKRIFERYFHGKDRSSSGIGLHLTSKLIEAHKAEINVFNSSFGGTEFMITLPVSSKAYTVDEFLSKNDIPVQIPPDYEPGDFLPENNFDEDTNKEKILLVEDDFDLRKYLKNILAKDHVVLEADNGKEGLELALQELPDLVVSDVMMPEMDGIELCEHLKKNKLSSHIPVLMLTAKTGDEFYNKGLEVGAWDYIAKPFDSAQLINKIQNILETRNNFRTLLIKGNIKEVKSHYVSYDQKFVTKIRGIVEKRIADSNYTVEDLSKEIGLSRMQLHRKLKSLTGLSTTAFINSVRVEVAVHMFDKGCDRVQEAMDAIGLNSNAHFITLFKKEKGITPSQYIEQIKNLV